MPLSFLFTLLFIFGAIVGSYLNVAILRLPKQQKTSGRSYCPNCKHQLNGADLVPLFSYVWLLGKCRYCGQKISARYFIIELTTAVLFSCAAWFISPGNLLEYLVLLKVLLVITVCILVFVIDLEHYLILDRITYPAIFAISLIILLEFILRLSSFPYGLLGLLLALLVAPGFFYLLWFVSKGTWMGFGDVKFAIFMALALGYPAILAGLFLSFVLGAIVAIPLLLTKKKQLASHIPFGVFLSTATVVAILFGNRLVDWYLRIAGI